MSEKNREIDYTTVDELFEGATPSNMLEDVHSRFLKKRANSLAHEESARELQNWSWILSKIVGQESRQHI